MKRTFAKTALAAAMLGAAIGAPAQIVVPWGNHDPGELGGTLFFGTGSSFPFEVIYQFSLANPQNLLAVGVSNDGSAFDINCQLIRLFKDNGNANFNDDLLIGSFAFGSTSMTQVFAGLGAGAYFYKVTGRVDGDRGGSYLVSSNLQAFQNPIPEPGSFALLGLGLAGLWTVRRKLPKAALAAAMLGAAISAPAQIVVPWGNHDPGELGGTLFFGTGSSFPFEVNYTFNLSSTTEIEAVGVTNDAAGVFDINGASVRLYENNGNANFNDDTLLGAFAFDNASTTHSFGPHAAGSYFYKVSGQTDGPFGGSYLLSSATLPAPVPSVSNCP